MSDSIEMKRFTWEHVWYPLDSIWINTKHIYTIWATRPKHLWGHCLHKTMLHLARTTSAADKLDSAFVHTACLWDITLPGSFCVYMFSKRLSSNASCPLLWGQDRNNFFVIVHYCSMAEASGLDVPFMVETVGLCSQHDVPSMAKTVGLCS